MRFLETPYVPTPEFFERDIRIWKMHFGTDQHRTNIARPVSPIRLGGHSFPKHPGERDYKLRVEDGKTVAEGPVGASRPDWIREAEVGIFAGVRKVLPSVDFEGWRSSVSYECGTVHEGSTHRSPTWHMDGFGPLTVLWADPYGTEYNADALVRCYSDFYDRRWRKERSFDEPGVEDINPAWLEPGVFWLVPTRHFVHRSPRMPKRDMRAFFRMSFAPPADARVPMGEG